MFHKCAFLTFYFKGMSVIMASIWCRHNFTQCLRNKRLSWNDKKKTVDKMCTVSFYLRIWGSFCPSAAKQTVYLCAFKGQTETDKLECISFRSENLYRWKSSHINMTFQCHPELLGPALMAWPLRNDSIDCSHTRWNLSICHNLVSCLRLAYKQALIEWSQFTETKWRCLYHQWHQR